MNGMLQGAKEGVKGGRLHKELRMAVLRINGVDGAPDGSGVNVQMLR